MTTRLFASSLMAAALLAGMPATGGAPTTEYSPYPVRQGRQPVNDNSPRILVKFRSDTATDRAQAQAAARSGETAPQGLARRASLQLLRSRQIAGRLHALQLDTGASGETAEQVMARLRADPQVEYVELDRRQHAHAVPNDSLYTNQWYLQGTQSSAIRAEQAWDTATGNTATGGPGVVVAVLDTGILFDHPDLQRVAQGGRLLPGYDFVSGAPANDGDDWDSDPSDPGDWVDSSDQLRSAFSNCDVSPSSWHGTRVAGLIGAKANNAIGISGITWTTRILPVRVLGKCGGFDSDIIPAMRWAGGLHVDGVPDNANPARVINMSLGSTGSCSSAYRQTIDELAAAGVLVVVSAGNDTGHAVSEPANCPGVLAVAGLRHAGTKVGFSNIGPQIALSAPGGNCVNSSGACLYSLDTTTNLGTTVPQAGGYTYTDQFNINVGTSFSAPIVVGVAALVRSLNSRLTPAQTIIRLQKTATQFPTVSGVSACVTPTGSTGDQLECNCTTSTCGAGMLNANAAVGAALKPFVIATASPTSPTAGQTVSLTGTDSFASEGRTITGYAWTVVSSGGATPTLTGANTASASFTAPSADAITLRLTVTDSTGAQDSSDVVVNTPTAPQTNPPPNTGGGGGGGGGGAFYLFDLLFLFALARRRRAIGSGGICCCHAG